MLQNATQQYSFEIALSITQNVRATIHTITE